MKKVIFNVKTMDSATRQEYAVSKEGVEVSDDFAVRLAAHSQHGVAFEVEGHVSADDELNEVREEFIKLIGEKPGRKGIDTMKAEIEAYKLANPVDGAGGGDSGETDKDKK